MVYPYLICVCVHESQSRKVQFLHEILFTCLPCSCLSIRVLCSQINCSVRTRTRHTQTYISYYFIHLFEHQKINLHDPCHWKITNRFKKERLKPLKRFLSHYLELSVALIASFTNIPFNENQIML